MWIVKFGIANLLSVPHIEADGFTIDYLKKRDWVVTTPESEEIVFKKDAGKCNGFPFIDMDCQEFLAIFQSVSKIETVKGKYEGFTKKNVVKSISERKAQAMIVLPSEKYFKELVSENCTALNSILVTCADITNSHTIFGPNL